MIDLICSAISGFFMGVVSVYLWHNENYNTHKYNFMQYALSKRIDELERELSMKKFENERLYRKILKREGDDV